MKITSRLTLRSGICKSEWIFNQIYEIQTLMQTGVRVGVGGLNFRKTVDTNAIKVKLKISDPPWQFFLKASTP
jgi:hypothetical protein